MRKIIDSCHDNATKIIRENKDLLELIADALLEKETLTKEEIDSLVNTGKLPNGEDSSNKEVTEKNTEEKVKKTTKKKDANNN